MNKIKTNAEGQKPRAYRPSASEVVAIVIIILLIMAISWPCLIGLRSYHNQKRCGEKLEKLGKAMLIYPCECGDCNDEYPKADKWCELLVEYTDVTEKAFVCPSVREGRCHYAMNTNASMFKNPNMVVLFETTSGWNQHGGPQLLTFENHEGKGGNILFNDSHVKFIKPEGVTELNWLGN